MPKENRSSNTETKIQHPEGRRERFLKWVLATKHPVLGYLDGTWLARGDDREGYADKYVQGLWVAFKEFAQPAPQPHPDPIAWMVGTAFWWTKEEAERDAAETGLPVVAIGPVADPVEVERLKHELLVSRAQGRAEVVEMIAQLDAETGLDEFIGSHQIGCTGEWGSHWKEDALLQHFDVDPGAASELERCRHSGYEIIILEEERDTLRAQLTEAQALLKRCEESLFKLLCFGVPEDRTEADKMIDELRALSASAEPSAPVERHDETLIDALLMCEKWFIKHSPTAPLIGGFGDAEHPMLTCIRAALERKLQVKS